MVYMAQILFSKLMNAYEQPGNDVENEMSYGKYARDVHYSYMYHVQYAHLGMSPTEFMDWIAQYMTGVVMLCGDFIWFNGAANEATLILAFDGKNKYSDKILFGYHKNPNNGSFHKHPPRAGETWSY